MNQFRFLLIVILVVGFALRFYRFDNPIADWHSWRQADTSSVSRNFVRDGFDFLHPRMDNISNVQSGIDNPKGYFFVEFPLYNAAQAGLFTFFGVLTLEQWGRLVTIFSSTLATLFLYLLVSRHSNKTIGLLAAAFYAFIPYNIYFGRTILADTSMVMATLGGIYFFDRWLDSVPNFQNRHSGKRVTSASRIANVTAVRDSGHASNAASQARMTLFYLLAILFTAGAFLLKAHAVFFVLPLIYLAFKHFGWKTFLQWQLWLFAMITVAPLAWWRMWMMQYPEGIPVNAWLFNGNGIRFRPSFFRWIFYERLTKLMLGYLGIGLFVYGLFALKKIKEWPFFASFVASSLLYVCVVATGNVQHDYYQIPVMPTVAILCAIGSYYLWQLYFVIPTKRSAWRHLFTRAAWVEKIPRLPLIALNDKILLPVGAITLVVLVFGGLYFSWMQVRDFFNINNRSIIVAGEAVDRLTPKDAKIIANYNGDSTFLYQTNRKGWASFQEDLPTMIQKGASYLVLVNPTRDDYVFVKEYKIVAETKEYLIFDLKNK